MIQVELTSWNEKCLLLLQIPTTGLQMKERNNVMTRERGRIPAGPDLHHSLCPVLILETQVKEEPSRTDLIIVIIRLIVIFSPLDSKKTSVTQSLT